MAKSKKIVIVSDPHCGNIAGLWNVGGNSVQRETRDRHGEIVKAWKRPDIIILNGDGIDGPGKRNNFDIHETDVGLQAGVCAGFMNEFKAKEGFIICGTDYHCAGDTDHERMIGMALEADWDGKVHWELLLNINGYRMHFRHHHSSSGVKHGRFTAMARTRGWFETEAFFHDAPKVDLLVRSHVHYFTWQEDSFSAGMTTPALQARGSRYGTLRCDGHVDFGAVRLTIDAKGDLIGREVMMWPIHNSYAKETKR